MKLSLLSLALIPVAYGAAMQPDSDHAQNSVQTSDHSTQGQTSDQSKLVVDAIGKMTNNLLADTEKLASANGLSLEQLVSVPGLSVKSTNKRSLEKRGWTDYIPLVKSLTKNVLSGVSDILSITGFGDIAKIIGAISGFL